MKGTNNELSACREANRMILEDDPTAIPRSRYADLTLPDDVIRPTPRAE